MTVGLIDQRMSLRVTSGFTGGPQWNTRVVQLVSGRELRNKQWKYPLQKYTANVAVFSPQDIAELLAMFYACAGQWGAFRFRDPVDWIANGSQLAVLVGTKTPAQLTKTYTFGPTSFARAIQAPVSGTVVLTSGGTPIAGTCDYTTGLFTPTNNWPATPVQWSGQFDVWVRFDADYVPFVATRPDVLTSDIDLVEVRI